MENFYYDYAGGRISIEVWEDVYPPGEDSILLANEVEKISGDMRGRSILEMGCGSGLISILVSKLTGKEVYAADVNPAAVESTIKNSNANGASVKAVESDLFEKIDGKFGFIIFNTPYLPCADMEIPEKARRQWSLNFDGRNVIEDFLEQSKKHLEGGGKIIMLFSSLSGDINEIAEKTGFKMEIIARKKLDFEEIMIGELKIK